MIAALIFGLANLGAMAGSAIAASVAEKLSHPKR